MKEIIIDKDTDAKYVIDNFPIHWSIERATGLNNIITECKITGNRYKLSLNKKLVYRLERIEE
jgi:hypothetical protein